MESDSESIISKKDIEPIIKMVNNMDNQLNDNIDFIQNQLNMIHSSYMEIINETVVENNRYKTIIEEINNINDIIENIQINNRQHDHTCSHSCGKVIYTDVNKVHQFVVEHDIEFIYLTMAAGGGAGGVGFIDNLYYYSGGGGGAGSCVINKPVKVTCGTIIHIKVGRGSDLRKDLEGEDSYVEIYHPHCKGKVIVRTKGGCNGNPNLTYNHDVSGGKGGDGEYCMLDGCRGEDGHISLPSYTCALGGNGGASLFYKGGRGGGNYFGHGGKGGNLDDLIGEDGSYGSGGGGSCPKTIIDLNYQVSGNGGDGVIIIEW